MKKEARKRRPPFPVIKFFISNSNENRGIGAARQAGQHLVQRVASIPRGGQIRWPSQERWKGVLFLCSLCFSYSFIFGCAQLLSCCGERRLLSGCGAQASHCGGLSRCRAWALGPACCCVCGCSLAYGMFLNQGWNLCPLH